MHVLSRNDAFLVYALLRKFSLQKCRSREFFDLFQVWALNEFTSEYIKGNVERGVRAQRVIWGGTDGNI